MNAHGAATGIKEALNTDLHSGADKLAEFADQFAVNRDLLYEALLLKRDVTRAQGNPASEALLRARATTIVENVLAEAKDATSSSKVEERRVQVEQARSDALKVTVPDSVVFSCTGLGKTYGRTGFKLRDVSFDIRFGRITGVVGRNGNGKTTLFRLIVGEINPTTGTMEFPAIAPDAAKVPWRKVRQHIAYVPQELPRWYGSLRSNLHYEAAVHGTLGKQNEIEVDFIIERLGLAEHVDNEWYELSGGYQLRFALARALVWKPKLLILDEPLANLDFTAQQVVLKDLRQLADSLRYPLAVIVSSQHLHEIEEVSDDILFLRDGEVAYKGPVVDIGAYRTKNRYELGGRVTLKKLRSTLDSPEYLSVYHSGASFVIITTTSVTAPMVLRNLLDRGIEIDYFRDNSRGVKSLFEEDAVTP